MTGSAPSWTVNDMQRRRVRYEELRPCYNAFIDTRTPGSEAKENFTIIGPGVSENPEQFVHIEEAHGYNIGGARQPPGCVNSQHSHKTAEVFLAHQGTWRFDMGENGEDAQVVLNKGDVISIPTDMFRGFTNVGEDTGFLWAVLGKDDPGRVTWAPKVFEMAQDYGLVLLESGELIDTRKGQGIPDRQAPMAPTSKDEVAAMNKTTPELAEQFVWRAPKTEPANSIPLIGDNGVFLWEHGFSLERLSLAVGESTPQDQRDRPKVVFVHEGKVTIHWGQQELVLGTGDTFSVPSALPHVFRCETGAVLYVVSRTEN